MLQLSWFVMKPLILFLLVPVCFQVNAAIPQRPFLPPNYVLPTFQSNMGGQPNGPFAPQLGMSQLPMPQFGTSQFGAPQLGMPAFARPQPFGSQFPNANMFSQPPAFGMQNSAFNLPMSPLYPTLGPMGAMGPINSSPMGMQMGIAPQGASSGFGSLLSGLMPAVSKFFSRSQDGDDEPKDPPRRDSAKAHDEFASRDTETRRDFNFHEAPPPARPCEKCSPRNQQPSHITTRQNTQPQSIARPDHQTEGRLNSFPPVQQASATETITPSSRQDDRVASSASTTQPPPLRVAVLRPQTAPAQVKPSSKGTKAAGQSSAQSAGQSSTRPRGDYPAQRQQLPVHEVRAVRTRTKPAKPLSNAPIWNAFITGFHQCAPGCQPYDYNAYRHSAHSCHGQSKALDVHGMICGGQKIMAIGNSPRWRKLVSCMRTKVQKVLYQNKPWKGGRNITEGHYDHAHFSNGCTLKNGRRYW